MASTIAARSAVIAPVKPFGNASIRQVPAGLSTSALRPLASRPAVRPQRRNAVVTQAMGMEVAQIAGEAGFIGGVAGVMVAITLVGLAIGFVILRVENLVEEGKI